MESKPSSTILPLKKTSFFERKQLDSIEDLFSISGEFDDFRSQLLVNKFPEKFSFFRPKRNCKR